METNVVDLAQLRRGCAQCSLQQLCLPAGIGQQDLQQLDDIVRRRRPVATGERLFRPGDALTSVYVARDGASRPINSPGRWKPTTCSPPSSLVLTVLNAPSRAT